MDSVARLVPGPFVDLARTMGERDFMRRCAARHVVLVRVDSPTDELAAGLTASFEAGVDAELNVLAFHTEMADPAYFEKLATRTVPRRDFNAPEVRSWLGNGQCCAVPLAKRAGERAFRDRITVGRARNKDLMLRAPTVSKLHAWFEVAGDTVQLADAGSTNGTRLNQEALLPREPVPVLHGDAIHFGSVEATLAAPDVLWALVHN